MNRCHGETWPASRWERGSGGGLDIDLEVARIVNGIMLNAWTDTGNSE